MSRPAMSLLSVGRDLCKWLPHRNVPAPVFGDSAEPKLNCHPTPTAPESRRFVGDDALLIDDVRGACAASVLLL